MYDGSEKSMRRKCLCVTRDMLWRRKAEMCFTMASWPCSEAPGVPLKLTAPSGLMMIGVMIDEAGMGPGRAMRFGPEM